MGWEVKKILRGQSNILVSAAICNFLLFPINKFKGVSILRGVQSRDIILGGAVLRHHFGGCSLATIFWGGAVSRHHFGQGCSLMTSFWGRGGAVS